MPIGTLTGYAIRMIGLPWDHTYVTSTHGHAWGCHGRNAGGLSVCSGDAIIQFAECLADADGEAGIDYGITGLCHQIANRILYPSGKTVISARGARLSVVVYGLYGLDPQTFRKHHPIVRRWPLLNRCHQQHSNP